MIDDLFKLNGNTIQHLPNYSGETLWPFGLRSASSVLFCQKPKRLRLEIVFQLQDIV